MRQCSECKYCKETLPGLTQCMNECSSRYRDDVHDNDYCIRYRSMFARAKDADTMSIRLKAAMGRNYTAVSLAEATHVSESVIRSILRGKGNPNINTVISLARFFNKSLDWMCGLTD